jgi:hypothetical protein
VRTCSDKADGVAIETVDEQEISADVALSMVGPLALQWVVPPLRSEGRVIGNERQHRLFEAMQVIPTGWGQPLPVFLERLRVVAEPGQRGSLTERRPFRGH